ncbi:response regulator transcription factor [Rhodococcus sp. IEGM 1379]|uniref:response regulator n=1 Tax=Rhodococcus sp. IEGM 1379 TaxID=3047086 RepID=UPI0024B7ACA0|nr:response regulator transcription factor [Rhodococcus sp. IEGM 1379]MDI9917506.1 response regulator transcription factor [Rhodococcus sp. IEGM 1379]
MNTDSRITVLIVDNDAWVRRGMKDILEAAPDIVVVAEAEDGDQVAAKVTRFRPHVVLMDLKMARVGGLEATRELMSMPNPPKVIAMTAFDVDGVVIEAVEAGAHSFLRKDGAPEDFQQAVRVVASDHALFSRDSLRAIVASAPRQSIPDRTPLAVLTDREREVLAELATGLGNSDIAARMYLGETTIKSHISSLFSKLGVNNRVSASLVAYRCGLVT